jgi:hypothetical protein
MNMERYYSQLIGCKIVDFKFDITEPYEGDAHFPVFTIENKHGDRVILSLSSDEEGNSGGFGFIERAE